MLFDVAALQKLTSSLAELPAQPLDSPLAHVLISHDALTDLDLSTIAETIADSNTKLIALNSALEDLAKFEVLLRQRRDEYSKYMELHEKMIISPIRRLPQDLLSEIFIQCLRFQPQVYNLSVDRLPWTFGKVCRRWRSICLSTPQLWATIPRLYTTDNKSHEALSLLDTSLRLSSAITHCLDLQAYYHTRASKDSPKHPMIKVVSSHISRCGELALLMNAFALHDLFLINENLDSLETLKLRLYGPLKTYECISALPLFANTPMMRSLYLQIDAARLHNHDGPPSIFDFSWYNFAWAQLTSFHATYLSTKFILEVVANAPLLRDCSVSGTWTEDKDTLLSIAHAQLRNLSLHDVKHYDAPHECPTALLNHLVLPSLTYLHINYEDDYLPTVISFIRQSECSLTTFKTHSSTSTGILTLLAIAPRLTILTVGEISFAALSALTVDTTKATATLVPLLRHLTIRPQRPLDSMILNVMISSRAFHPSHGEYRFQTSLQPLAVRLEFVSNDLCSSTFYDLEGWNRDPESDVIYQDVTKWKTGLSDILTHADDLVQTIPPKKKKKEKKKTIPQQTVHELLEVIETNQPTHPRYLKACKIVETMARITTLKDPYLSENDLFSIRSRALDLVTKWTVSVANYNTSPHWSLTSNASFTVDHA